MATTLQFDRITNLRLLEIGNGWARNIGGLNIAGARAQSLVNGIESPRITVRAHIREASAALTQTKVAQLIELVGNPGYAFHYLEFPTGYGKNDGWYEVVNLNIDENYRTFAATEITLNLARKYTKGQAQLAQYWTSASETCETWTPTATTMVALPNGATNVDWTIAATRTTTDGTTQILENPTRATIRFLSHATLANQYYSECRVYDSVIAADTTEANWVQVFGSDHVFTGDKIFQNGLLRYKINSGDGTFYCYDSVAAAWKTVGELSTALTGNLDAPIVTAGLEWLSADEIRWFEWRHNGDDRLYCAFTLRRGALHCRVKVTTTSLGIDTATYVRLAKTNGMTQMFNASANGAGGAGNLATDVSAPYHCAYNTTDDIVFGFVLCDKPTYQPTDIGTSALAESNTWSAGVTRTFFVIAWQYETSTFNLTTARAAAASIAAQCLKAVQQEPDLIPLNYSG